jgi:hypothetical protein
MKSWSVPTNFSNAALFFPDDTGEIGGFNKSPMAQTLVTLDYTQVLAAAGTTIDKVAFILDKQTTPLLVISNSVISGTVLTFIISGGWSGLTYGLTVQSTLSDTTVRTDVLQIEIMGDDCMRHDPCYPGGKPICAPSPIPKSFQQAIMNTSCSWYGSSCVRYYICDMAPANPNVLDQWYNTTNHLIQEYLTDGVNFWWQPFFVDVKYAASSLYYLSAQNQTAFITTTPDINNKSGIINVGNVVQVYVNGVRLVPNQDFGVNQATSTVVVMRPIPANDVVMIDILAAPTP